MKRYIQINSFNIYKRCGYKKCTDTREDRLLKRRSLADREKTTSEVATELQVVINKEKRVIITGSKGCKARKKYFYLKWT